MVNTKAKAKTEAHTYHENINSSTKAGSTGCISNPLSNFQTEIVLIQVKRWVNRNETVAPIPLK
jgi:hypothetical protein